MYKLELDLINPEGEVIHVVYGGEYSDDLWEEVNLAKHCGARILDQETGKIVMSYTVDNTNASLEEEN
jgi:hypothetical protein